MLIVDVDADDDDDDADDDDGYGCGYSDVADNTNTMFLVDIHIK